MSRRGGNVTYKVAPHSRGICCTEIDSVNQRERVYHGKQRKNAPVDEATTTNVQRNETWEYKTNIILFSRFLSSSLDSTLDNESRDVPFVSVSGKVRWSAIVITLFNKRGKSRSSRLYSGLSARSSIETYSESERIRCFMNTRRRTIRFPVNVRTFRDTSHS